MEYLYTFKKDGGVSTNKPIMLEVVLRGIFFCIK